MKGCPSILEELGIRNLELGVFTKFLIPNSQFLPLVAKKPTDHVLLIFSIHLVVEYSLSLHGKLN